MAGTFCAYGGMPDAEKDRGAGVEVQELVASPPMFSIRLLADVSPCGGHQKLLLNGVHLAYKRDLRHLLKERDVMLQQSKKVWIVEFFDPDFQEFCPLSEDLSELRGRGAARLRTSFVDAEEAACELRGRRTSLVDAEETAWKLRADPKETTENNRRLTHWDLLTSWKTPAFRNPMNWSMPASTNRSASRDLLFLVGSCRSTTTSGSNAACLSTGTRTRSRSFSSRSSISGS